jgi:hypothetical protein
VVAPTHTSAAVVLDENRWAWGIGAGVEDAAARLLCGCCPEWSEGASDVWCITWCSMSVSRSPVHVQIVDCEIVEV